MRRIVAVLSVMLALLVASRAQAGNAGFVAREAPVAQGDQLIFYYDARPDYTTFITIRNNSNLDLTVNILFYGPTFGAPFSRTLPLTGGAFTIVDIGSLRDSGLPAQPGIALAAAVNVAGQPIVSRALTGNSTVANLLTGSAFGAAAAGRFALDANGVGPLTERVIDGNPVRFQPVRASTALLAGYYNPDSLAPAANGGNQLIFINFEDVYQPTYGVTSGSTTWQIVATRDDGSGVAAVTFTANGVTVSDLATVLGPGVNGAAGGINFATQTDTPGLTRLVYFTEALGTFGTGYLLPALPEFP